MSESGNKQERLPLPAILIMMGIGIAILCFCAWGGIFALLDLFGNELYRQGVGPPPDEGRDVLILLGCLFILAPLSIGFIITPWRQDNESDSPGLRGGHQAWVQQQVQEATPWEDNTHDSD